MVTNFSMACGIQKVKVPKGIQASQPIKKIKNFGETAIALGMPKAKAPMAGATGVSTRTPAAIQKLGRLQKEAFVAGAAVRGALGGIRNFAGKALSKLFDKGVKNVEQLSLPFVSRFGERALPDLAGQSFVKRLPKMLTGRSTLGSSVVQHGPQRYAMSPRQVPGYIKSVADAGGKAKVIERGGLVHSMANKAGWLGGGGAAVALARGHNLKDAATTGANMAGTGALLGAGPAGWATLASNPGRRALARGMQGMRGIPKPAYTPEWTKFIS